MGCGSSTPIEESGGDAQKVNVQEKAGAAATVSDGKGGQGLNPTPPTKGGDSNDKGKTTRARRLSYVTADANGQATGGGAQGPATLNGVSNAPPPPPGAKPSTPQGSDGSKASANTRARRLSYFTNDPNARPPADDAAGPGETGDGEEGESGDHHDPMVKHTVPGMQGGEGDEKRPMRVAVACMSRAGREPGFKKTNQDNCFAFEKYITEDQSLFGAMDGHGPHGHLVSGYVKQHLPIILVNHLTTEKEVGKALHQGFVEVDASLGQSRIDCEFSGSTAVVSYLKGSTLVTAWVGDSRGVMGRETKNGWEAVDLTNDHKPTSPEEKARILRNNGRVERLVDELGQPMGPFRVWLQYAWIPGLAMSRALGDALAHKVGVTSEPDVTVTDLTTQDKFIVLASDGVWEFISSKEAVEIIAQYDSAEEACRQLVDEAYQRWLTEEEGVVDDITAVVVRFIHD